MSILPRYIRNMDKTATRAVLVSLGLFALVIAILVMGKYGDFVDLSALQRSVQSYADSPWGLPFLILVFCLSAFIGVPQFALIAGAVAAFGPWQGALYSWIATLVSGALTFWLGRFAGEETFRRYAGNSAQRMSGFVGRNAFAASAIVRNVPTGPFIVVNMGFGVIGASFLAYWGGMALGIIPKIAVVTFLGESLGQAISGNPMIAVLAALAAGLVWFALMLFARRRIATSGQNVPNEVDIPVDSTDVPAE